MPRPSSHLTPPSSMLPFFLFILFFFIGLLFISLIASIKPIHVMKRCHRPISFPIVACLMTCRHLSKAGHSGLQVSPTKQTKVSNFQFKVCATLLHPEKWVPCWSTMSSQSVVKRESTSWIRSSILFISFWQKYTLLGLFMGSFWKWQQLHFICLKQGCWRWCVWCICTVVRCFCETKRRWVVWGTNSSKDLCICDLCISESGIGRAAYNTKSYFFRHKLKILCICVFKICDFWFV